MEILDYIELNKRVYGVEPSISKLNISSGNIFYFSSNGITLANYSQKVICFPFRVSCSYTQNGGIINFVAKNLFLLNLVKDFEDNQDDFDPSTARIDFCLEYDSFETYLDSMIYKGNENGIIKFQKESSDIYIPYKSQTQYFFDNSYVLTYPENIKLW